MRYHTDLGALIASAKCLNMSMQGRLMVTDEFVRIPEAHWQDVSQQIRRKYPVFTATFCRSSWSCRVHPIEVNSARDNSEMIQEASRPGDESTTKSIKSHFNGFLSELECYQLWHQWYMKWHLRIESIDDNSDNSVFHTPLRVTSPAMPKPILLQFALDDTQLIIISHFLRASAPTAQSGSFTNYVRFTSILISDGS